MIGPNVKQLIIRKMSLDAVSAGGGFPDAAEFLMSKDRIVTSARNSERWVALAIQAMREAAEPNPWKGADDETIAGEILRRVKEKERK